MRKQILVLGLMLTMCQISFGQINKRQQKQDKRVDQGVKSGEITKKKRPKSK